MAFPPAGSDGVPSEPVRLSYSVPFRPRRFQHSWSRHVILFLLTLATTTIVGALHYRDFSAGFNSPEPWNWTLLLALLPQGLWYSLTILAILGAHEMGHYFYCRKYNVDATLPYFIPAPLPLTGTLGAVIRIREPFPTRAVLFDIGVAGPLAGFFVLLPPLFYGLSLSQVMPIPSKWSGIALGVPLLFQWAGNLVLGPIPADHTVNLHPMVFAAWFGMLATALNLLPFGQLDGGHIAYATLGRFSTVVSIVTVLVAVAMTFVSLSWLFMTLMMVLMLVLLGPRHPRVIYEHEPLGAGRRVIAILAVIVFAICFTPVPLEPLDLIRNP